jgi:lipopolysaccharide export system protein LptA
MNPALLLALFVALIPQAVLAQPPAAEASKPLLNPLNTGGALEITAEQSLEYHQEQNLYLARGNAKIIRGDVTLFADELRAYERAKVPNTADKTAKPSPPATQNVMPLTGVMANDGSKEVYKFTAQGKVRIVNREQTVTGEQAVYDLDQRLIKVTGGDLRFVGQNATVTAAEALEYWPDKKQAIARGNAKAVRDDRQVSADRLIAQFSETAKGGMELQKLIAEDNVVITTKTDVARGSRAVYDLASNRARLEGAVQITRGASQLAGNAAEVDFKTGISRLVAGQGGVGRVKGLFVPSENTGAAAVSLSGDKPPTTAKSTP